MNSTYRELRGVILEFLREHGRDEVHQEVTLSGGELKRMLVEKQLIPEADTKDARRIASDVFAIFHELYLERIIVPCSPSSGSYGIPAEIYWPKFRLTEYGRRAIETAEYLPYDPEGYLNSLTSAVPNLDGVVVRYIGEALDCHRRDCTLAAAVMIGCASERAMLLLIEGFGNAIRDRAKHEKYEKETADWKISVKYRKFRKWLERAEKALPEECKGGIERNLAGAFNLIRETRNDAGHPTGRMIERDDVLGNLILFPGYCKYVYSLLEYFASNPADV